MCPIILPYKSCLYKLFMWQLTNYYDTLYSFVSPIILQYKSCLYINIIFIVIFYIPIESNKTISLFCTYKFNFYVNFLTFSTSFSIRCFCLLLPIPITTTNYMNNFKVTHGVERRGRCHHAVIPRPARTGPGAVQGATWPWIEWCNWCTWGGWVPPQLGRAPAPALPEAILDVDYRLVDHVLPGDRGSSPFVPSIFCNSGAPLFFCEHQKTDWRQANTVRFFIFFDTKRITPTTSPKCSMRHLWVHRSQKSTVFFMLTTC